MASRLRDSSLGGLLRVFLFLTYASRIMIDLAAKISEAAAVLVSAWESRPEVGIVLGTGLGGLAAEIVASAVIPYEKIPHFPKATVTSHTGQLVCGSLSGKNV